MFSLTLGLLGAIAEAITEAVAPWQPLAAGEAAMYVLILGCVFVTAAITHRGVVEVLGNPPIYLCCLVMCFWAVAVVLTPLTFVW